MTATPIPRTLALILYGDLDISIIDELPPGRQPIETIAIEHKRRKEAYENLVRDEVEKGRQVYVVCPLVEESEKIEATSASELVEELKREFFSDLRVGLLHGKMRPSEKDAVMDDFKNKKLSVKNLLTNEVFEDNYDKLVLTLGSWPIVPKFEGGTLDNIVLCKNYNLALNIIEKTICEI